MVSREVPEVVVEERETLIGFSWTVIPVREIGPGARLTLPLKPVDPVIWIVQDPEAVPELGACIETGFGLHCRVKLVTWTLTGI